IVPYSELNAYFVVDELIGNLVHDEVGFDDQSTGGVQGINTWYWDFEEAQQVLGNGGDTQYAWNYPGNHDVTLIDGDHAVCTDTFAIILLITIDVEVPNVFTPSGYGVNEYIQLQNDALYSYNVIIEKRW